MSSPNTMPNDQWDIYDPAHRQFIEELQQIRAKLDTAYEANRDALTDPQSILALAAPLFRGADWWDTPLGERVGAVMTELFESDDTVWVEKPVSEYQARKANLKDTP